MTDTIASGTFDVSMTPASGADAVVARMTLTKTFHGDLKATSSGEMLAVRTPTAGSAGYVAIEHVVGTLAGHHGSFALQHSGTMTRGVPVLSVTVVPDSGTGELQGLVGAMTIDIVDGQHRYGFTYTLPR